MFKLFLLITIFSGAAFATDCVCKALPESKKYIGEARQKKFIGFVVHWTCDYTCVVQDKHPSGDQITAKNETVTAEYQQYYFGQENGLEGICESMVYTPAENIELLRTIYSFEGEIKWINPRKSESDTFKAWAIKRHCSL